MKKLKRIISQTNFIDTVLGSDQINLYEIDMLFAVMALIMVSFTINFLIVLNFILFDYMKRQNF